MEILTTAADVLTAGIVALAAEPGRLVMMVIGCVLMYLGIKKEYEPTLLVPMGLGTILVNIPSSGVIGETGPFRSSSIWASRRSSSRCCSSSASAP